GLGRDGLGTRARGRARRALMSTTRRAGDADGWRVREDVWMDTEEGRAGIRPQAPRASRATMTLDRPPPGAPARTQITPSAASEASSSGERPASLPKTSWLCSPTR